MPKLSLILPCYNVDKYLEKCLDSLINQTEKDIEIILVDDCSTDNSFNIIQKYAKKDKRIKLFKTQTNAGYGAARNLGRDNATGEYIWFVDSDDYLEPDACEVLYNEAKNNKLEILCFNARNVISRDVYDKVLNLDVLFNFTKWPVNVIIDVTKQGANLSEQIPFFPWTYIVKNSFLKQKFPEQKYFENVVFTSTLFSKASKLKVITYTPYNYVLKEKNIFQSPLNDLKIKCEMNNLSLLLDYISSNHIKKNHFLSRLLKIRYKYFLHLINQYEKQMNAAYIFSGEEKKLLGKIKSSTKKSFSFYIKNIMPFGIFRLYKRFTSHELIYLLRK